MRGRLLALWALLGLASLAQASYVVIIANLHARPPSTNSPMSPDGGGSADGGGPPPPTGGFGALGGGGGILGSGGGGPPPSPLGSGGGPRGGMGGGMGFPPGFPGLGGPQEDAADDAPYIVVAVVEVQDLSNRIKLFKAGQSLNFYHPWGKTLFGHKTYLYQAIPLETSSGKLLPSIRQQFQAKLDDLMRNRPTPDQVIDLARQALAYGLLTEFTKVMDRLAETEKGHPLVANYLKVKEALSQPPSGEDVAGKWKGKLLEGYHLTQTDKHHFALLHTGPSEAVGEVKQQLDRLEWTFQSFYYWWALRGVMLPLPKERQVAILTDRNDDFRKLKKHLTASPIHADSFFARREGVSVFSAKRSDDSYVTLEKIAKPEWDKGFNRTELLRGLVRSAMPKGTLPHDGQIPATYALLMKALEDEWEKTAISHEASRHLLYASGLLPRNVVVPEWIQFGLGSFFEMPLQSPWGGPGGASPYWLPRFKESYKAKHYNANPAADAPSPYEALMAVITDGGFRSKPKPGETAESHLRRSRAAAWSLTYFLAQRELDGLQKYMKELGRMPRDVELDDKVLLGCFARAFGCWDNAKGTVNRAALTALATRWISFINDQKLDAENIHKQLRDYYKQVTKDASSTTTPGAGGSTPGVGIPPRGGSPGGPPRPLGRGGSPGR